MNSDNSPNRAQNDDKLEKAPGKVNLEEDIHDSPRDEQRLQPDVVTMDLPDVSDIPGQENVHVPPLGELADTTISSDDEEGKNVFNDE